MGAKVILPILIAITLSLGFSYQDAAATTVLFEDPFDGNFFASGESTVLQANDFVLTSPETVTDVHFYIARLDQRGRNRHDGSHRPATRSLDLGASQVVSRERPPLARQPWSVRDLPRDHSTVGYQPRPVAGSHLPIAPPGSTRCPGRGRTAPASMVRSPGR